MTYNEAETRFFLIDPVLRKKGYDEQWKLRLETPGPAAGNVIAGRHVIDKVALLLKSFVDPFGDEQCGDCQLPGDFGQRQGRGLDQLTASIIEFVGWVERSATHQLQDIGTEREFECRLELPSEDILFLRSVAVSPFRWVTLRFTHPTGSKE